MPISFENGIPVEFTTMGENDAATPPKPTQFADGTVPEDSELIGYVTSWRTQLRAARIDKQNIWNECWQLYRGLDDFSSKEDWQAKLVLPKAFSSVKQATNVIRRLLSAAKDPWMLEPYNPEDLVGIDRADKMTKLSRTFLERAKYMLAFAESVECSFITGVGVVKEWWGLVPRTRIRVQQVPVQVPNPQAGMAPGTAPLGGLGAQQPQQPQGDPTAQADQGDPSQAAGAGTGPGGAQELVPREQAPQIRAPQPVGQVPKAVQHQDASIYPTQLPNEAIGPLGGPPSQGQPATITQMHKQIIKEEVLEGQLFVKAVDPYLFYWLPGSKLNAWTGTIEEMEIPKWELMEMAESGIFDGDKPGSGVEKVKNIKPMVVDEWTKQSMLRFSERSQYAQGPVGGSGTIKLTEFYGPIVLQDETIQKFGHLLQANDNTLLINSVDHKWVKKPPYIAFSPLKQPFRTEGVGLIEMVREVNRALSRIANLSVDSLMYRLMPLFEVNLSAYENPEDFETGMTPGKVFRRNQTYMGQPGITPIRFDDLSQGAFQVSGELDRSHQEGAFVSEIQQGIPRYRGQQSATEISEKSENQNSFFGSMASDIEQEMLLPMVNLATDLIFQFVDSATDPRVASILGVDAAVIGGMSREELMELIQGEYSIKVTGLTGQLQKAEMLQNLVQMMNIIGQNPEAWLPYLNQDELLRRVLESFRPAIHDIEKIIADPATAAANKVAQASAQMTPQMLQMIPALAEQAHRIQMDKQKQMMAEQQNAQQLELQHAQQAHQMAQDKHLQNMDVINAAQESAHKNADREQAAKTAAARPKPAAK